MGILDGRKALVTGGASGLGLALSKLLTEQGVKVVVCGRRQEALDAACAELSGLVAFRCDLAGAKGRRELGEYLKNNHPDLSVVIHNAAINQQQDYRNRSVKASDIQKELDINLTAPIDLTSILLPQLREHPRANIVFITSALARVPKKSAPVYCASKAGLSNFARTLSYQLKGTNIKISEAIPALIKTAMTEGRIGKNMMTSDDVAHRIVRGLERDEREIRVGPVRFLYPLHRMFPRIAYRLLMDQ